MSEAKDTAVSSTAKFMAAFRAIETQRLDGLFTDPFAAQLAGQEAIEAAIHHLEEEEKEGKPFVSVRTRFFDDFLNKYSNNVRQVVLLGSGMDTRAFRINWQPGTHIYEIDQPDVLLYKNTLLNSISPHCIRHSICADLKESLWTELLVKEGYQTSEPTIWLLEGFLYYLNSVEADNILKNIQSLSIKGSYLGADVMNTVACNSSHEWAKYWQFSCDEPELFFATYGWKASAIQPGEEGASFGRFTYQFATRNIPNSHHIFFVIGIKQN